MAVLNINKTHDLDTVDEVIRLLSEARSLFAMMGVADPSEMPKETMSYAACAGQRLLDQAEARMEATLR